MARKAKARGAGAETAPATQDRGAAPEIAAKLVRAEIGGTYAESLLAILPEAESALTEEERRLVVSDERLEQLRKPLRVEWSGAETDAEAEDAAQQSGEGEGEEAV